MLRWKSSSTCISSGRLTPTIPLAVKIVFLHISESLDALTELL